MVLKIQIKYKNGMARYLGVELSKQFCDAILFEFNLLVVETK